MKSLKDMIVEFTKLGMSNAFFAQSGKGVRETRVWKNRAGATSRRVVTMDKSINLCDLTAQVKEHKSGLAASGWMAAIDCVGDVASSVRLMRIQGTAKRSHSPMREMLQADSSLSCSFG